MNTTRVLIFPKMPEYDFKARHLKNAYAKFFPVGSVAPKASFFTAKSFLIHHEGLDQKKIQAAVDFLLTDSVVEVSYVATYPKLDFDFAAELAYQPGVTDNLARTAETTFSDYFSNERSLISKIDASRLIFCLGDIDHGTFESWLLATQMNALIEKKEILNRSEWENGKRFENEWKVPHFQAGEAYQTISLELADEQLIKLSNEKILSLSLEEMKAIQAYYQKNGGNEKRKSLGLPAHATDVELEAISQTWSEHCKHKIFAAEVTYEDETGKTKIIDGLFKTTIKATTDTLKKKRKDLLSVFTDNAGVVSFDKDFAYALKVETHNSPSALDPYGGAMTGIVGVNRDILGTGIGAKPIFNTDVFCFADPHYSGKLPPRLMHPRRIFEGVHRGVKDGGNESGIPTVNGAIVFHERFLGKPLVFCGTGGFLPKKINGKPSELKFLKPGQKIVMVGGRIGKDGIHGATFSSAALTEASPTSAVQIGDPITQKKMIDFILEARDLGLYAGLTDNGAGGLSSSIGEMAQETGGARIDLDKAPLKYPGLQAWEILISEAQERMTLGVAEEKLPAFLELAKRREVEATEIGDFTSDGYFHVTHQHKTVACLDMEFLHKGLPRLKLKGVWKKPVASEPNEKIYGTNLGALVKKVLARPNVASKEHWVRFYDHEVQAQTIVKPFEGVHADGPSDAAVLKPRPDSYQGLVISNGLLPRYADLDAASMAECAVDEALRNLVATGGDPNRVTGLDNFCWPDPVESESNPDGAYKMAQLVRACEALQTICLDYNIPLISGKDSMKNDYGKGAERISVPPTLLFTAATIIDDVRKSITTDFKKSGSLVYLLGLTKDELGGSELYASFGELGANPPSVDRKANLKLYQALHAAMKKNLVLSAHDLSDGGLAVSAAEMCFGGNLGLTFDLSKVPTDTSLNNRKKLFSESQGRFLVEVPVSKKSAFEKAMSKNVFACLGKTTTKLELNVSDGKKKCFSAPVPSLKKAWKDALVF
jgi:phosphoribosylformylglycinamidine synthase